jgi:hypothetical protein
MNLELKAWIATMLSGYVPESDAEFRLALQMLLRWLNPNERLPRH